MLQIHANAGVTFFRSPLLDAAGVRHGFSTRLGGVSTGPFASLNLGQPSNTSQQDQPDNVAENWRRFQAAVGVSDVPRIALTQVHGAAVVLATPGLSPSTCGDALFSNAPEQSACRQLLAIRVADCVPILLSTPNGKRVAAIHAGWRGVVANIIASTVAQFDGATVVAAIGPCIGTDAFEVGQDVARQFETIGLGHCVRRASKPHIDLVAAVETQLRVVGVKQIDLPGLCTHDRADLFYSHRRDRGLTGRMAAVVLS